MANPKLFKSKSSKLPATTVKNEAGGVAYKLGDKVALAQMACTSFLADQYYDGAEDQLSKILGLCHRVPNEWVAKVALYARKHGYMKDTPSLLVAWLARNAPELCERVFPAVVNNGRMVRNVVQMLRSGQIEDKHTIPQCVRRSIRKWLNTASTKTIFEASVGKDPSLADVIKMVHVKAADPEREALFGRIIGKEINVEVLPQAVKEYDNFKSYMKAKDNPELPAGPLAKPVPMAVPDLPFQMLDSLGLGTEEWRQIAMTRERFLFTLKNLNTFERHGVLKSDKAVQAIANRLMSQEQIEKAMVFPYQILTAYRAIKPAQSPYCRTDVGVLQTKPPEIVNALHLALEIALKNVPEFAGRVAVCTDISGSMHSPISGRQGKGKTSVVRCLDVAALFSAAVLRKNPLARLYPFSAGVVQMSIDPTDSVMTMSDTLCSYRGGATDWDAPLRMMVQQKWYPDLCVYFSDMQGWVSAPVRTGYYGDQHASSAQAQWTKIRKANPKARLIMVNLQAYDTVQVVESEKSMLVGGFSDEVFKVSNDFAKGELDSERWVGRIDSAVSLENSK